MHQRVREFRHDEAKNSNPVGGWSIEEGNFRTPSAQRDEDSIGFEFRLWRAWRYENIVVSGLKILTFSADGPQDGDEDSNGSCFRLGALNGI